MQPTVSVIVPVYNRKAWLQELIASLRAQTYPADRFEVIVVDNGSTDGAWEWIEAQDVAGAAPRIRAYRNDTPFRVPSGSRNVGLRYATGDIVAFTDSDCITQPGWLERGVACLSEGFGLVVGRTVAVPWDKVTSRSKIKVVEDEGLYDTCNIFYKREAIERVGGGFAIDVLNMGFPVYGEDSELGFRVKAAGYRSAFAGDAIVMHHVREQSFRQYFSEAKHLYSCPYLVKKHPETRRTVLYRRVFLSRQTALFDLAVAGLALGFASFLVSCACPVRYDRGGLRRRPTMFLGADLYVSDLVRGVWQEPQNIGAPINRMEEQEGDEWVSADGSKILFTNGDGSPSRPRGVYYSRKVRGVWSAPVLASSIGLPFIPGDENPRLTLDEQTLFLNRAVPAGLGLPTSGCRKR